MLDEMDVLTAARQLEEAGRPIDDETLFAVFLDWTEGVREVNPLVKADVIDNRQKMIDRVVENGELAPVEGGGYEITDKGRERLSREP